MWRPELDVEGDAVRVDRARPTCRAFPAKEVSVVGARADLTDPRGRGVPPRVSPLDPYEAEEASASLKAGFLRSGLPKAENARAKTVEVE